MNLGTRAKKGFGILEVLLAGVVIITMLGALVFVARTTINNTLHSMQSAQAAYLAQEGIEIIRQIRDSNYIDGNDESQWDRLAGEYSNQAIVTVAQPGWEEYCIRKKTHNSEKRYHMVFCTDKEIDPDRMGQVDVGGTTFKRFIYFYPSGGKLLSKPPGIEDRLDNSYRVHVEVSWSAMGKERKVAIDEIITNSRQGW